MRSTSREPPISSSAREAPVNYGPAHPLFRPEAVERPPVRIGAARAGRARARRDAGPGGARRIRLAAVRAGAGRKLPRAFVSRPCRRRQRPTGGSWRRAFDVRSSTCASSRRRTARRRRCSRGHANARRVPAVRIAETFGRPGRYLLARALNLLEQSTRSAAIYHQYLREHAPDLVVLTPMIVLKTAQLDLARAALELGIRNVFAVASWDHLSSKGDLTFQPQRVIVWNDVQKREAVELQHLDGDRVIVTGSQIFDDWFGKKPSTSREEFCARVGLRPDRPIVLYVCSSLLEGSTPEPPFVVQWARHLRESGHPALRECGILVRPHHEHGEAWRKVNFKGMENVACWPKAGRLSGRRAIEDRLLRFAVPRVGHGRPQHERDDRGRHPRPPGAHDPAAAVSRQPGRNGSLPLPARGAERAPACGAIARRACRQSWRRRSKVATPIRGAAPDSCASSSVPGVSTCRATDVFVRGARSAGRASRAGTVPGSRCGRPLIRPVLQPFANAAAERVRRMEEESRRRSAQRLEEHRQRKAPQLEALPPAPHRRAPAPQARGRRRGQRRA